ncbi:MAG: hypothetical protein ACRC8A_18240 [Microcoleaceae cyanobacterium]
MSFRVVSFRVVSFLNGFQKMFGRAVILGLMVCLFWLSGTGFVSAQAASNSSVYRGEIVAPERLAAVISCLPKQLSEPSLARAIKEMGNDYLERTFQLKKNPKVSQAEAEFGSCLRDKGYELRVDQFRQQP